MKAKELIEKLKKLPQDYEVVFHQHGACFDTKAIAVIIDAKYGKERKQITIKG